MIKIINDLHKAIINIIKEQKYFNEGSLINFILLIVTSITNNNK